MKRALAPEGNHNISPMPSAPQFDEKILEQLACPACRGDLRLDSVRIVCAACGRAYPIIDGIPVLIPNRAEPLHSQQ
jgi:uncharacterized protein YbaR (Trm112 family)